jgi:hypothetical protein
MEKLNLLGISSIIEMIGVFEFENRTNELLMFLEKNQSKNELIKYGANTIHKNLWYSEKGSIMFIENHTFIKN